MGIFQNKFFSFAGQKERLKNVIDVIKAPFSGGTVKANTSSPTVNKVLQAVSNNPFKTAAVGGTVANIPKAVSVVKGLKAASNAKKASKIVTATQSNDRPGLLDINELGSKKTHSNAPGVIKPTADTGGLITKATETFSSSPSPRQSSPRRARSRSSVPRKRRRARRGKTSRRSRRTRGYGTAAQYARKGGKSVKYTKNGQPYIILSDGRARFVKGKRRK